MTTMCDWIEVNHWPPDEFTEVLASFEEYGDRKVVIAESWIGKDGKRVWKQASEWCHAEGGWDGATLYREDLPITHWAAKPNPPR